VFYKEGHTLSEGQSSLLAQNYVCCKRRLRALKSEVKLHAALYEDV
jgi:hypothetical protein